MKTVFALLLCLSSVAFATESAVIVPVIDSETFEFISTKVNSKLEKKGMTKVPKYYRFTDASSDCSYKGKNNFYTLSSYISNDVNDALKTKYDMLQYAAYPSEYNNAKGGGICFTGDAEEALGILLGLADCALTDQFVTVDEETKVVKSKSGVERLKIVNTSNDDGTDVTTSYVSRCRTE